MPCNPTKSRRRAKVRLKSLSLSVLGIGGGVGWEVNDAEQKAAQKFVAFLEDRRVLFNPFGLQIAAEVDISIDKIRSSCTELIANLDKKSPAALAARGIRQACRKFLDQPRVRQDEAGFFIALGEFRAAVGLHIAALAEFYELDVEDELATILPKPLERDG